MKILKVFTAFLTLFINLVTFVGDVTIWGFRGIFIWVEGLRRVLRIPKRMPSRFKGVTKVFRHPVIREDFSFKVGLLMIFVSMGLIWFATKDLPSPRQLETREVPLTTKIYDRNGELLFNVYTDQNRTVVPLSEIPDNLKYATIAIEDQDFYKHKGFDVYGIIRAARETVFQGDIQGGSTITQQLVKSAFLTPERTITRKVKELYLAFRVEMAYPKDRILEMYLNQVPYGGTAWGAAAAAEQYFGKDVKDLTLAESALLAGLPQAPTYYSPFGQDKQRSVERQRQVLTRMVEENYITREQAEEAAAQPLEYRSAATDIRAPHFVMFVREYLAEKYGEAAAAQGGLKVTTTLELKVQEMAQGQVTENIDKLKALRVGNGAAVVTKPQTGEILAMVGSKDFFDTENDGNVNVTVANRQPGSSIKPINYATALAKRLITPATVIMDVPTTFSGGPQPYRPVNYDGKFHGPVQVRFALANSYNIPAVKVLGLVGVGEMIKMAREMGITTFEDESRYGLSLTLGGGEVKMTEMATAFGVFANEGVRVDLVPVLKVEDSNGRVLEEFKPKAGRRVLSPEIAFLISSILSDNGARSAAFGANSMLNIRGKTVAVKTGTTDDKRDNWTIGYNPSFLVVTWVGNNDNSPMHPSLSSGVTGAAPIWNGIMTALLNDKVNEAFKVPSGVVGKEICTLTGGTKNEGCNNRFEYFLAGTEPTKDTFARSKVWIDKETGKVVQSGSPNAEEKDEVIISDPYSKQDFCASCPRPEASPSPPPT
ncbi:MAG: penicillin-binding protein 1C [Candidatus Curtissbacteria bacterium]|nr:penicillin-binding protein 1C [Candidatus Curtissbacteria bacterium]